MTERLVPVASLASQVEAEHVVSMLLERGITAFLEGANANTTFSSVGSSLGGVQLIVRETDISTVQEILASLAPSRTDSEGWFCTHCEEMLDQSFEICWSCGKDREEVGAEPPTQQTRQTPGLETPIAAANRDLSNPYSPSLVDNKSEPNPSTQKRTENALEIVRRAHRAAWIGTLILPILLHAYSIYLLLRVAKTDAKLPKRVNRLWNWTLAIDIASICFWLLFLRFTSVG